MTKSGNFDFDFDFDLDIELDEEERRRRKVEMKTGFWLVGGSSLVSVSVSVSVLVIAGRTGTLIIDSSVYRSGSRLAGPWPKVSDVVMAMA